MNVLHRLGQLYAGVHEDDGRVETRLQDDKEQGQGVLAARERHRYGQPFLLDHPVHELLSPVDHPLHVDLVRGDDFVPGPLGPGIGHGVALPPVVPDLDAYAMVLLHHLLSKHPRDADGNGLPLVVDDHHLVARSDVEGGRHHTGGQDARPALDERHRVLGYLDDT